MRTPKEELAARLSRVRLAMEKAGADVLVTGSSAQEDHRGMLRYLTDYYISVFEEYLVVHREGPVVFFAHDGCGASYMEELGTVDEIRPIPGDEYNACPGKCVADYLCEKGVRRAALAGLSGLSAPFFRSLTEKAGGVIWTDLTEAVRAIRMIKSPYEIALSKAAVRLNEADFLCYLDQVKAGACEWEAIQAAASYAWKLGCEDQYWLTDTGVKPCWRPLPLAREKRRIWKPGDLNGIVLEHSAEGGHYSEVSRHIAIGEAPEAWVKAYAALAQAQNAAFAAMKPGNTVGQVAEAAEAALRETEYGVLFAAGQKPAAMGHSQGLDTWEFPRIIRGDETVLQPGMRLNLHPSVKTSEGAAVSFCDLYLITESGAEKLSALKDEIYVK